MTGEFRISDMHSDVAHPVIDINHTEIEEEGGPNPALGWSEEQQNQSIVHRIRQFGIDDEMLIAVGVNKIEEITPEQFNSIMREAVNRQYEVLFGTVYGEWGSLDLAGQRDILKRTSEMYRQWGVQLVGSGAIDHGKSRMVIALEGADMVHSMEDLKMVYESGVRSFILQYSRPNALADQNGLTSLGGEAVRWLLEKGACVDLAHNVPVTRTQILTIAKDLGKEGQIAYSHGALVEDIAKDPIDGGIAGRRGITDQEVQHIIKAGGIVGLSVSRPFFQSLEQISTAIDKICQKDNGPHSLALGTDFGGVSPMHLIKGISNVADLANLGEVLSQRFGYTGAAIKAILRDNLTQWSQRLEK